MDGERTCYLVDHVPPAARVAYLETGDVAYLEHVHFYDPDVARLALRERLVREEFSVRNER